MGCTKTVVVAGASGFIGTYLRRRFQEDGWTVRTIGRKGTGSAAAGWDDDAGMARVLNGAGLVVNLAGRSVSCRYNRRNKTIIMDSRVATTQALGRAIAQCPEPPATWLKYQLCSSSR